MSQIRFLSEEQEALIPQIQAKWHSIYLSTEPIDRDRSSAALKEVYAVMGQPEPEIIFCDSPRSAIEQLERYVAEVEVPKAVGKSAEEIFNKSNFFKLFIGSIWNILKSNRKQKKAKGKIISDLIQELSRQPNKLLAKHIDNFLPKDLTTQQIVEQSFLGASPLFAAIGKYQSRQGDTDASQEFAAKSSSEQQASFSTTATALEQQLAWLPGKKWFFRQWLRRFLQGTITSKITGIEHPKFRETIYSSLSSFAQLQFLAENPPLIKSNVAITCIWLDFAFSVLDYPCKIRHWQALQELVKECGWVFFIDNTCYICDRPTKILIDEDGQLHGEGESVLEYADGSKYYAYHGNLLPEKYGAIHPSQWQPEWVLEKENELLRKFLIKEIGATRICQELPLIELEKSGEYTLFRLDENTGTKAIHILSRINSDTGETKAVLVSWTSRNLTIAIQHARENYSADDFPLIS